MVLVLLTVSSPNLKMKMNERIEHCGCVLWQAPFVGSFLVQLDVVSHVWVLDVLVLCLVFDV